MCMDLYTNLACSKFIPVNILGTLKQDHSLEHMERIFKLNQGSIYSQAVILTVVRSMILERAQCSLEGNSPPTLFACSGPYSYDPSQEAPFSYHG